MRKRAHVVRLVALCFCASMFSGVAAAQDNFPSACPSATVAGVRAQGLALNSSHPSPRYELAKASSSSNSKLDV